MRLADLLTRVRLRDPALPLVEGTGIASDWRRATAGDCFFAMTGGRDEGHGYAADAVGRGAVAVVAQHDIALSGAPVVYADDSRAALALAAANLAGHPSRSFPVAGITGTD